MTFEHMLQDGTSTSFVVCNLAPGADPAAVWAGLAGRGGMACCEPLRGPWDLLCRFDGALAPEELEQRVLELKAAAELSGVQHVRARQLLAGRGNGRSQDGLAAHVLASLEIDPGRAAALIEEISGLEPVTSIELADDGAQLIIELAGAGFTEVDGMLRDRLSVLDGVLRFRAARIVRLPVLNGDAAAGGCACHGGEAAPLHLPCLQRALWRYQPNAGELIPLLQQAQEHYGYVPPAAIELIAGITGTAASEIYGIVTFYAQFRLTPLGRYLIRQCQGTACHVNGAKELQGVMEDELGITLGETDAQGLFTLTKVACLGCCSLAPVLMVNDDTHGRLDAGKLRKILRGYRRQAKGAEKKAAEQAS